MNPERQLTPQEEQKQQQIISQDMVSAIMEENKRLKDQYAYDNEWIKFLSTLAENDSLKDIVDFINTTSWTDRQKIKIMAYSKVMLSRGLSTTYITGITDYRRLQDDFTLVDCNLILGMTVFDITPEFNILVDMIKMHFGIEIRRSKGGHFIERIGTQRMEVAHDTTQRNTEGFKEKLWKKIGVE
jgi:hypothetical protein